MGFQVKAHLDRLASGATTTPPAFAMSHRNGGEGFFDCTALEGDQVFVLRSGPTLTVAVHEGLVASILHGADASAGAGLGGEQSHVAILAVHDADRAIILEESDGEELAFGFADQGG